MRISFTSLWCSRLLPDEPTAYLARLPLLRCLPAELARRGHDVSFVHLRPRAARLTVDGVTHVFEPAPLPLRLVSTAVGRARGRDVSVEPSPRALRALVRSRPEVVHFHGVGVDLNLALVHWRVAAPCVVHFHGGAPARWPLRRFWQRRALRRASRVLFSTAAHARPYLDGGALEPRQVFELIETSSPFAVQERAAARQLTGMHGRPVLLCAARLDPVKDPLVVLEAFDRIVRERPSARLYWCYLSAPFQPEVRAFLGARPELARRVELLGRREHAEMESIFNSADVVLQASRREFSGVSILDAMACGVVPVVTDLPSLRAMTAGGRYGRLVPVGDAAAMAAAVLGLDDESTATLSREVRRHFESELSFAAMARRLEPLYAEVIAEWRAGRGGGTRC